MKRTYRLLPLALLTLALVAVSVAPAGAANQVERPYKSNEAGFVVVDLAECDDTSPPLVVCPNTTTGTSNTTHLGKTTTTSSGTSTLDFGVEPCLLFDGGLGVVSHNVGTGVFEAANGDKLFVAFQNTGCADLSGAGEAGPLVGTQTFTGGTGRFAGASGTTVVTGVGQGDTFVLEAVGTISY